jgi:hypothetical protein
VTIYINVPVREDRLPEVFKLLSIDPLHHTAELPQAGNKDAPDDTPDVAQDEVRDAAQGDASDDAADGDRDDARWDAFWAERENVREHLAERSDLIHAIIRFLAGRAEDSKWYTGDDIAAVIGESPSSIASSLGPLTRYLFNRDLDWPFRWQFDEDGRVEYQMAPAVAAVVLDMLKAETPQVST